MVVHVGKEKKKKRTSGSCPQVTCLAAQARLSCEYTKRPIETSETFKRYEKD